MKILIVLTSHSELGISGKKTGFWLEALAAPYYIFKDSGALITLASVKGGLPPLDPKSEAAEFRTVATERFIADKEAEAALASTFKLKDLSPSDYDALFYPGGQGLLWDLAEDAHSIALVETMYAQGKPVAAVCHAAGVLRHANSPDCSPLVQGKSVTGQSNSQEALIGQKDIVPFLVEDELKKLGGNYSKGTDWQSYFVTDGNLITGQSPASSEAVAKAVLAQL
jgi:putative intracellular protease/amidase